jgi:hypothetical protein
LLVILSFLLARRVLITHRPASEGQENNERVGAKKRRSSMHRLRFFAFRESCRKAKTVEKRDSLGGSRRHILFESPPPNSSRLHRDPPPLAPSPDFFGRSHFGQHLGNRCPKQLTKSSITVHDSSIGRDRNGQVRSPLAVLSFSDSILVGKTPDQLHSISPSRPTAKVDSSTSRVNFTSFPWGWT